MGVFSDHSVEASGPYHKPGAKYDTISDVIASVMSKWIRLLEKERRIQLN